MGRAMIALRNAGMRADRAEARGEKRRLRGIPSRRCETFGREAGGLDMRHYVIPAALAMGLLAAMAQGEELR